MPAMRLRCDSYLGPTDAFAFVRKTIGAGGSLHCHDFFEVLLVERGELLHQINGGAVHLPSGALVFIRPDDVHTLIPVAADCQIINIAFRAETADHLAARYGADLGARFFWKPGPEPETLVLIGPQRERAINTALELQTSLRALIRIEEFLLTIMLRVAGLALSGTGRAPDWLLRACEAAREPRVFRRGATGFVEAAGRSHEHVCRTARTFLGLSPSAYVNRLRMEYAAMELGRSDHSISEIAALCGIENLSHFHGLFRRHYGVTPRAYRKARGPVHPAAAVRPS
ncbi:MAG: AraC family transcriptional regulator [Pseudomonadota bacterium]